MSFLFFHLLPMRTYHPQSIFVAATKGGWRKFGVCETTRLGDTVQPPKMHFGTSIPHNSMTIYLSQHSTSFATRFKLGNPRDLTPPPFPKRGSDEAVASTIRKRICIWVVGTPTLIPCINSSGFGKSLIISRCYKLCGDVLRDDSRSGFKNYEIYGHLIIKYRRHPDLKIEHTGSKSKNFQRRVLSGQLF